MKQREKHGAGEDVPLHTLSDRFIAHANAPRNVGKLEQANGQARGIGTCGDSMEVFLVVNGRRIKAAGHLPHGCAYTTACASAVTTLAVGRSLAEALDLTPEDVVQELGGLPEDHRHCAVLAVNTLGEAIDDYYQKVWGQGRRDHQHL